MGFVGKKVAGGEEVDGTGPGGGGGAAPSPGSCSPCTLTSLHLLLLLLQCFMLPRHTPLPIAVHLFLQFFLTDSRSPSKHPASRIPKNVGLY